MPYSTARHRGSAAGTLGPQEAVISLSGVSKRYGPKIVAVDDLSLSLNSGEFLALLGPSGCGKSTTLRLLAGLEAPDSGWIVLSGRRVAGQGSWEPPEARNIGMVFQDYALFPHLTIAANIGFPLSAADRHYRRSRVDELLELVDLGDSGRRYPHQISGGQQQRVALARALATDPALVLLDEPFSNLDAALRENTRSEVRAILARAKATTILVTHDQEEALSLADTVAVMFDGALAQVGNPEEIYLRPATRQVASFVGAARFFDGEANGEVVRCPLGTLPLARPAHGSVSVLLRPEAVTATLSAQGRAQVVSRSFFGPYQIAALALPGGHLLEVRLPPDLGVNRGDRFEVEVRGSVVAFPR